MSDYPMLISNKLHSFRNFTIQKYNKKMVKTRWRYVVCNDEQETVLLSLY